MRLIRFRKTDTICPGIILPEGLRLDCSEFGEDYNEHFFDSDGPVRLAQWLKENADSCPVVEENVELAQPIARPSKLICIGLNYRKHAEETGNDLPKEPVIFMKATSAITGPNDGLILPDGSKKTDWEVELDEARQVVGTRNGTSNGS
ncbi:MAG: fumarylacetoacetate hydrolase family protein [Balneolaceae bacterium]